MSKLFKQLKFGMAPVTITPAKLAAREQILISYIRTCGSFYAQVDVEATAEIFGIAKEYVGRSFKLWVLANYMGGSGARAPLCRHIAAWVNGQIPGRIVIDSVRRDLDRLNFLNTPQEQVQSPIVSNLDENRYDNNTDFSNINDSHFFALLALLGPELTAHFCLSLSGIRYK